MANEFTLNKGASPFLKSESNNIENYFITGEMNILK